MQSVNSVRECCTGCGSCSYSCKESALVMKENAEGFIYPYIKNDSCLLCGECLNVCPLNNGFIMEKEAKQYCYVANNYICWESADGGAVVTLINEFISAGGLVCAPVFTEDYCAVKHKFINIAEEACLFGYVESNAYTLFDEIKNKLLNKEKILFIGTPCELSGLRKYVQDESENLYLVALGCQGKSSAFVWGKFIQSIGHEIKDVKLHSKELGCDDSIKLFHDLGIYEQDNSGSWISLFKQGILCRKACLNCGMTCENTPCDIWLERGLRDDAENDGKGISYLDVMPDKGNYLIALIDKQAKKFNLLEKKRSFTAGIKDIYRENLVQSRQDFFYDVLDNGFNMAYENTKDKGYIPADKYVLDYHCGKNVQWIFSNNVIWQSRNYDGYTMLFANGQPMERAFLPFTYKMTIGKKYDVEMKYKAISSAGIRILFANEASKKSKAIFVERLTASENWNIVSFSFDCNDKDIGYIFFTSSDVTGKNNMLCFDWIRIWERRI